MIDHTVCERGFNQSLRGEFEAEERRFCGAPGVYALTKTQIELFSVI